MRGMRYKAWTPMAAALSQLRDICRDTNTSFRAYWDRDHVVSVWGMSRANALCMLSSYEVLQNILHEAQDREIFLPDHFTLLRPLWRLTREQQVEVWKLVCRIVEEGGEHANVTIEKIPRLL